MWALVSIVNNEEIPVKEINCKYLTAGHTQTLADTIHANTEKRIRRLGNVYDLSQFLTTVSGCKKNVETIQLEISDMKLCSSGKKQVRGNVSVNLACTVYWQNVSDIDVTKKNL